MLKVKKVGRETMDVELKDILAAHEIVGAVYAVFDKDKLIETAAFGWANIEQQRLMNCSCNMRLASLSKVVTTTAIMQLREQNKLELDNDISDYLGYLVRNPHYPSQPITVRQLMMHTGSLADSGGYNALVEYDPALLLTTPLRELIDGGWRQAAGDWYSERTFLNKLPGEHFLYSNLGYIILGSIVELLSGMNFCAYCETNILQPLQMPTAFDAALVDWENTATLYKYDSNGSLRPVKGNYQGVRPVPIAVKLPLGNAAGFGPQGGLMCSVPDYAKFLGMIANGGSYQGVRLLTQKSCDLLQQLQWFAPLDSGGDHAEIGYWQQGLDLQVTDDLVKGLRLAGHGGDAYGLIAGAYFDRMTGKGFVMAFNGGRYLPDADSPGFLTVETAIAGAIVRRHADFFAKQASIISFTNGARAVVVNSRLVELPGELSIDGELVPEITLNDVFGTPIASLDAERGEITLANGNKTLKFVVGKNYAIAANGERILLQQAPYYKAGHFWLPLGTMREYFAS
ncbi:MAG: serine hydrolase [Bacillota bacterium]